MSWFRRSKAHTQSLPELAISILYNEHTFYNQFTRDLRSAKKEVIIESPYITTKRLKALIPIFENLKAKNIPVFIITKAPQEHDEMMAMQSELGIHFLENLGIQVLIEDKGHHRKLAMIDRKILWEGSLNILSQANSHELMRRIEGREMADEMFQFLRYDQIGLFRKVP